MMLKPFTSEQLAQAYKNACMAELQALKPGNVHVFSDGHGMTIHDFIKSADVSADIITRPDSSVGERIYFAVEATQNAVGLNTNLGLILLCAPLIHAAAYEQSWAANIAAKLERHFKSTYHQRCTANRTSDCIS